MNNRRSLIQRTCLILGLIALSTYLFYIGKGHVLLLDTNTLTINGTELRSFAESTISVNNLKPKYMGRAERTSVSVMGPKHTIVISDDSDANNIIVKSFTVPTFMNRVIVSIPAIIGNAPIEHWVTPFTPPPLTDAPVEKMQYYNPVGGNP